MTQEEACALLGITDGDSEKAIDIKYKRLMREYHPDANEGRPEAAQMASRINEAHDLILAGIRDGSFVLPGERSEQDAEPTLAELRRRESEKPKKEVFFTKEDMIRLAEDMEGEMAEKPLDFDALQKHAKVLRKMVAAHSGAAPQEVVSALEAFTTLSGEVERRQAAVSAAAAAFIRPGSIAMSVEQRVQQQAPSAAKKDIQSLELQVEELRMAMYKLMDGKNPKFRGVLEDAEDFLENEASCRELADSLSAAESVVDEVRTAIREGREELEACRAKRRSRIITAVLCTVIVAAGILITFLLVTRM